MLRRLVPNFANQMSQSNKPTPPVTPVQTRLSSFFFRSTPSPEVTPGGKRRALSIDSLPPSPLLSDVSAQKKLRMSQTSEPSLGSQTDSETDPCPARPQQEGETADKPSEEMVRLAEQRREEALKKRKVSVFTWGMGSSWKSVLRDELSKPYFLDLVEFVDSERSRATVYPPPQEVFAWTTHSHIQDVKVVILGQDPYHGPSQAHGLCFSVTRGVPAPPSLLNMYKELRSDVPGFEAPKHGHLVSWAEQGVLLLNACLTVRAREPNSHKQRGWEKFTDAVVQWINQNLSGIVFLLWGKPAQDKGSAINSKKHLVLRCAHPSPLSADRGFFGCKHFSKTNDYLKGNGKKPIDWSSLSPS